jgi:type IV pilus assembly protein PilC
MKLPFRRAKQPGPDVNAPVGTNASNAPRTLQAAWPSASPTPVTDDEVASKPKRVSLRRRFNLLRSKLQPATGNPNRPRRRWQDIEITPEKVKREEVMNFARQMSSFVKAGIPVIDALSIIAEDNSDRKLREILAEVAGDLGAGSSLADALSSHAVAFPRYFISMVQAAELTGRLDEVLDQLAGYIDRDLETRRKVKSAMTYPTVILLMAIGTIGGLAIFVLPKFQTFFDSFDAELPWATRYLVATTHFIGTWGLFLVLLGTWLFMFVALVVQPENGKLIRDRFYLRVPKVGELLRTASIERFCRILSVMVSAGVPLPDALTIASETTGNRVYKNGISRIRSAIVRGAGLAGPVNDTNLFPAAARQMIRVGEATGTLEQQLASSAEFYGRELEYKLKRFTDLFEPAIISFMGLVVGFTAYALVSAMYGVFKQVNV